MSRFFTRAFLCSSILAFSAGTAFADYTLNILHINDFHSRIEPINKYDSTCSAEEQQNNECFGGVARVKAAIDRERGRIAQNGGNVLVVDAGDQFQGSLFYTTYKGEDTAEFMNGIGFDAMVLGNHEFDDGPQGLAAFLDKVKFPVISGNVTADAKSPVAGKYKPYIVKEIGGQKIGIVSVLATDTQETSSPGPDIHFEDEIAYLKGAVADLQKQGINKIIAVTHVGYLRDKAIAAAVDGIDVIVGGHSHTLLSNTDSKAQGPYPTLVRNPAGKDVPIVTAYAYSKYLGDLTVTFDDAGNVVSAKGDPILLGSTITPDAAFAARVAELAKPLEELKNRVVARTETPIDGSRETCRAMECPMGNLVADATLDRVKDQGITIAIMNGGGLRASIDQGEVTMGEVLTVLPFQNTLSTFQLKGADVVTALETGVGQVEEGAGRFPQVAGLKFAFDRSKPAGSRISDVMVKDPQGGWKPIDPAATYGVVSNNYLRGGGDGYKIFATNGMNAYDYGPGLEEVVAEYLAKNQPYKPYTDGRIQAVSMTGGTEAPAAEAPTPAQTGTVAPAKPSAPAAMEKQPMASQMPAAGEPYIIKSGDTYWDLAESFYGEPTKWRKLHNAHPSYHPRRLPIGGELTVPAE
ncbi:multifunctional 2',3'-cyclic-nucleotide 2'-phosphodiesterase/5'-nucleotidase/3'-nucleotidase [Phyllobacterium phragmitis]|uniref:Multifunctional 2',3'-cyclic-nucleotide 2'-phosphodiesterase/5'-nucleotidase/3'-nucleotidase n=1 Tax=Phyllobacterium phragmitis TaxID=2670329 RepID=A0A2S9IQC2_9HYPH|nr:bifunctional metallophosphatase/5'-nucleotidase [Phyllobacterium phragmitis]PRD42720.1 multifunctional 2',3'-cyclic-nucleotide 2'-phosphodiesterase/5'-nucleotidase/3'-nucleotidase [Phyllobacterium phragmitis]